MSKNEGEVLDKIFSDMKKMYDEMAKWEDDENNNKNVFSTLAELGRTLVDAERVSFWRWDKRRGKLITNIATGIDELIIDEGTGLVGKAIEENRTLVINDPHNHPDFTGNMEDKTAYKVNSMLVMPVVNCRGETIGAFQALNKKSKAGFDEAEDVKRLSIAAFICGLALASDLFLDEARHDKLTGLKNRLCFYSDWHGKYRPFTEMDTGNLSFIICDIDDFKKVNDTYGHNMGDAVLETVANILQNNLPPKSSAYRWGGEEFLMVLPNKTLETAANIAEEIRAKISQAVCKYEATEIKVTMSFGCAAYDGGLSLDENIAVADSRLYLAKANGKNCVVCGDNVEGEVTK
ncbi:MAG: sensor domain-containing diguanylate cyclase [Selenomonadaceae bacterium]|nr:sensor domain-containing diguanylate cyclase [Selenomonadaceae bacterium]